MQFVMKSNHPDDFNDGIINLKVERVITGKAVRYHLARTPQRLHRVHRHPVQMLQVMSRDLINLPIIAVCRCAKELKPCGANVCSPFLTAMSQHKWRPTGHSSNSPAAPADLCVCVCACMCACFFLEPDILTFSTVIPCATFFFLFHCQDVSPRSLINHLLQHHRRCQCRESDCNNDSNIFVWCLIYTNLFNFLFIKITLINLFKLSVSFDSICD